MTATAERVPANTAEPINARIDSEIEDRLQRLVDNPLAIDLRLEVIDGEWDVERMLQANAATVILASLVLGLTRDRRLLVLPFGVAAFLLQHAVQGWCPPLPVLRRLGFRTMSEIERERHALRILRGDTDPAGEPSPPMDRLRRALAAAREPRSRR